MLNKKNTVLLLVDVQGRLAEVVADSKALFQNVAQALAGANILGLPTICTEQIPAKLGPTRSEIAQHFEDSTEIIPKSSFSCCGDALFRKTLNKLDRNQVLICGIEAHICVCQTALELLAQGREVHLLTDATSSRHPQNKDIALKRMAQAGATLSSVEMALFELLGDADCKQFKQLLKIVKC